MTDQQHPITPPQWQVDAWCKQALAMGADVDAVLLEVFRAGADQELEACCRWASQFNYDDYRYQGELRAARRPRPKSQAEEALEQTNAILNDPNRALLTEVRETLELNRRALERLRELEGRP